MVLKGLFGRKKSAVSPATAPITEKGIAEIEAEVSRHEDKIIAQFELKCNHQPGGYSETKYGNFSSGNKIDISNPRGVRTTFHPLLKQIMESNNAFSMKFTPIERKYTIRLSAKVTSADFTTEERESYHEGTLRAGEQLSGRTTSYTDRKTTPKTVQTLFIEIIPGYDPSNGKGKFVVASYINNPKHMLTNFVESSNLITHLQELLQGNLLDELIKKARTH